MTDILDQSEIQDDEINEDNLLQKIWLKPRKTIRYIVHNCPKKYLVPLLIIGGVYRALSRAVENNLGEGMSWTWIVLAALIGGAAVGWLVYYLGAGLVYLTGRWLDGQARFEQILAATVWSVVPDAVALLLYIPLLVLLGDYLFIEEWPYEDGLILIVAAGLGIIQLILGLWSLYIWISGLAEVQMFSIGKAVLNLILAVLVVAGPLFLIVLMVSI